MIDLYKIFKIVSTNLLHDLLTGTVEVGFWHLTCEQLEALKCLSVKMLSVNLIIKKYFLLIFNLVQQIFCLVHPTCLHSKER